VNHGELFNDAAAHMDVEPNCPVIQHPLDASLRVVFVSNFWCKSHCVTSFRTDVLLYYKERPPAGHLNERATGIDEMVKRT